MLKPVILVKSLRITAYLRWVFLALALAASLALFAPSCPAQKTETHESMENDGQGNVVPVKVEIDSDKDGNVIERREYYKNGRIRRRIKYYPRVSGPPDTRENRYWPDGTTIKTETDVVTDGNGNITVSVTTYDKDGKVIKQTKSVYNPRTGELHCYEWNNDKNEYVETLCIGTLTQAEIQHSMQLAAERMLARRAKDEEDRKKQAESRSAQPPVQQSSSTATVGVVLPAGASGEISGIVTDEPKRYSGVPGLQVVEIPVQLATGENGKPTLQGLQVSTGGPPQSAQDPIVCPPDAQRAITLTPSGNPQAAVTRPLTVPQKVASGQAGTTAPPICERGRVAVVHRTFQGDSTRTLLALGDVPITPAAENQDAAYFLIPDDARPGLTHINVAEGSQAASVSVCVLGLATSVDQPTLHKNQETNVHVQITGPEELPEEAWRAGYSPDLVDLAQLRALVPGFQPPGPGEPGMVYVFMQNLSPDVITMEGAQGQARVFALSRESFPFSWTGKIHALRDGGFNIHVLVVPFLAEVPGRQFQFQNTETGPDLGPPNPPAQGGQPGAQPPSDPVAQHLKELNAALKKALDAITAGDYPGAQRALDDAASIKIRMLLGDPFGGTSAAGTSAAGWISFIADFDALLRDANSSAPTISFFGFDSWAKLKKDIEDAKKLKEAIEARVPPQFKGVLDYLRAMNIALNQALNAADNHDLPGVRKALADAVKAKWDLVFKGPFGVKIHGVALSRWMAFEEYFDDKIRAARGLLDPGFFPWWPKDADEAKKLIEKAEEVKKQIEAEGKTTSRNP
jgi:hypothetical protein